MSELNKVTLVGSVVHEPARSEEQGERVVGFVLATAFEKPVGRTRRLSGDYLVCRATGKLGDIIAGYVRKGSKLYVEGRLRSVTGAARARGSRADTVVELENVIMLGHRSTAHEGAA